MSHSHLPTVHVWDWLISWIAEMGVGICQEKKRPAPRRKNTVTIEGRRRVSRTWRWLLKPIRKKNEYIALCFYFFFLVLGCTYPTFCIVSRRSSCSFSKCWATTHKSDVNRQKRKTWKSGVKHYWKPYVKSLGINVSLKRIYTVSELHKAKTLF